MYRIKMIFKYMKLRKYNKLSLHVRNSLGMFILVSPYPQATGTLDSLPCVHNLALLIFARNVAREFVYKRKKATERH